jgi:phosphohistidine phosphatase
MHLYLMRHGEAKTEEEDPLRPLSNQGEAEVKKIAAFVAQNALLKVYQVWHSGKTRAQQTAEIMATALNPGKVVKATDGLEPGADPWIWVRRLSEYYEDIMLVGHLPHLHKLAASLLAQNENKKILVLPTAGIACLHREEISLWSLRWLLIPDMLI